MTAGTTQLRSTLRQLRQVPFDHSQVANLAMAPQEMLDFLAMLEGLKPVYLLGRGFDDPQWIAGVAALAEKKKLHVLRDFYWDAQDQYAGIDPKITAILREKDAEGLARSVALYVCKAPRVATELKAIAAARQVSVEDEARLLGYPVCCVRNHYQRTMAMQKGFALMLARVGKNDPVEIKRLVVQDVPMEAETEEEEALLRKSYESHLAPFTSVFMCDECVRNPESPVRQLSARYEQLAKAVDRQLWEEIAATQREAT